MRIALFLVIAVSLSINIIWLSVVAAIWYAARYTGFELFWLGLVIDSYFGMLYGLPFYSMMMLAIIMLSNLLVPRILFYNEAT
ncbi:MAG: hypothetical protein AAGA35_03680 [Patescibacteria group bacterium]